MGKKFERGERAASEEVLGEGESESQKSRIRDGILYRCYRNSGIFPPLFGTTDLSCQNILRGKYRYDMVAVTKQERSRCTTCWRVLCSARRCILTSSVYR